MCFKKFASLLLICILTLFTAFVFTGCGGDDTATVTSAETSIEMSSVNENISSEVSSENSSKKEISSKKTSSKVMSSNQSQRHYPNQSTITSINKQTQNTTSNNDMDPLKYLTSKEKIYYGYDPDLYKLGLKNEGNSARIAALMKKAQKGGNYKIAVLGGSISAGAGASSIYSSYGNLICEWWCTNFPNANFEFVCAGLGSTNPDMACYRIETDLLKFKPDFVVVDFNVNTYLDDNLETTYSTLLYKILSQKNSPAVMSIEFTYCDKNNYSVSKYVSSREIASAVKAYDIPTMSYHNYIWKKIKSRALSWIDIGYDYIHPNDNGHMVAANLINSYLNNVKDNLKKASTKITTPKKPENTAFINLGYVTNTAKNVSFSGGFSAGSNTSPSNRGWSYVATSEPSTITVPVPTNRGVRIFMCFSGSSGGGITVKDSKNKSVNIFSSQAQTPTLVDIGKMEGKITIETTEETVNFTIYGVGTYN